MKFYFQEKTEELVDRALVLADQTEPIVANTLHDWRDGSGRLDVPRQREARDQACEVFRHMAVPRAQEIAYEAAWHALIATERYARAVGWQTGNFVPSSLMERHDISLTIAGKNFF